MSIRFFLKQLLTPPGILIVLIALAWLLHKRSPKLAGAALALGLGGLWALSLPVTVQTLAGRIEDQPYLTHAQWSQLSEQAQAIVVLGAGREPHDQGWGSEQPSLFAIERLRYAARIARASDLPVLISGGAPYGQPLSEAAIMAEVFQTDFAQHAKWLEPDSRTTWENAQYSAALLKEAGIKQIVLVTQTWHMPRARWCFEQFGLEVLSAPIGAISNTPEQPFAGWLPETKALWQSSALINELLGQALYPLFYRPDQAANE